MSIDGRCDVVPGMPFARCNTRLSLPGILAKYTCLEGYWFTVPSADGLDRRHIGNINVTVYCDGTTWSEPSASCTGSNIFKYLVTCSFICIVLGVFRELSIIELNIKSLCLII